MQRYLGKGFVVDDDLFDWSSFSGWAEVELPSDRSAKCSKFISCGRRTPAQGLKGRVVGFPKRAATNLSLRQTQLKPSRLKRFEYLKWVCHGVKLHQIGSPHKPM